MVLFRVSPQFAGRWVGSHAARPSAAITWDTACTNNGGWQPVIECGSENTWFSVPQSVHVQYRDSPSWAVQERRAHTQPAAASYTLRKVLGSTRVQ
jgi:hypothetical protein